MKLLNSLLVLVTISFGQLSFAAETDELSLAIEDVKEERKSIKDQIRDQREIVELIQENIRSAKETSYMRGLSIAENGLEIVGFAAIAYTAYKYNMTKAARFEPFQKLIVGLAGISASAVSFGGAAVASYLTDKELEDFEEELELERQRLERLLKKL